MGNCNELANHLLKFGRVVLMLVLATRCRPNRLFFGQPNRMANGTELNLNASIIKAI